MRVRMMVVVVEGLIIWSYGGLLLNGVPILSSILLRSVVKLARIYVLGMMGLACVILGCFVGIQMLVGRNLCWLKKQKDTLAPERQESGKSVRWTSGLVFGKGEGIVGLETEYGMLHIKLLPDCAPHSIYYILQLLELRHCAGCHFYGAEGRGQSWDTEGNHIKDASLGPPFAIVQGMLEAQGTIFKKIPKEDCPTIRRGSVAWVGSGPEFIISLANHEEWRKAYTVFGSVLPEDMVIVEKIAALSTKSDIWNEVNVSVLEKPVPFWFQRIQTSKGDLNDNAVAS